MSFQLMLEFSFAEKMVNEGITEKMIPLGVYIKKNKNLTIEEAQNLLHLLEDDVAEKKANILKRMAAAIAKVVEDYKNKMQKSEPQKHIGKMLGKAKEVRSKAETQTARAERDRKIAEIKANGKKQLDALTSWASTHKKGIAIGTAVTAATIAAGAGAKKIYDKKKKAAENK